VLEALFLGVFMKIWDRWLLLAVMLGGVGLALGQEGVEQMPNAVAICAEGCTITVIPPGTVYQFGTGTGKGYTPARKAKGEGASLLVSYHSFSFDPAPNKVKTFYVQQKVKAYPVTYLPENAKTPMTVTVSALGSAPMATPGDAPAAAVAAAPAANSAPSESAKQAPAKVAPPPVRTGPPPAPPPSPTTLQVLQYTCAAPVAGTVIPPGLPNGIAVVCVYGLSNLPLTAPAPATPAK
jgi:hypothetical protein